MPLLYYHIYKAYINYSMNYADFKEDSYIYAGICDMIKFSHKIMSEQYYCICEFPCCVFSKYLNKMVFNFTFTGIKGEWIFGFPNVISNDTIHKRNCLTWARDHGEWYDVQRLSHYIDKLPTCPCKLEQAKEDGRFIVSDYNNLCVITWGQGDYFRVCIFIWNTVYLFLFNHSFTIAIVPK